MNEEKSESRRAVKLPPYPGLEKVHRANLRLLKEIDRICRKYKISYMLDSGTLLGGSCSARSTVPASRWDERKSF